MICLSSKFKPRPFKQEKRVSICHLAAKIKAHGRAEVSIFRYGLDYLIEAILNLGYKCNLFKICLNIIRGDWPNNVATESHI